MAGVEPSGEMRNKKLHALVARSRFRTQNAKAPQCRSSLGSSDVEKMHADVARSTFGTQNVQST